MKQQSNNAKNKNEKNILRIFTYFSKLGLSLTIISLSNWNLYILYINYQKEDKGSEKQKFFEKIFN